MHGFNEHDAQQLRCWPVAQEKMQQNKKRSLPTPDNIGYRAFHRCSVFVTESENRVILLE